MLLLSFSCSLILILIGCGEKEEEVMEKEKGGEVKPAVNITVDQIVGEYDLVSFYIKEQDETIVIGTKEAGDLKHILIIKADSAYSITETEAGKTYTESGSFALSGNNITFEIKKSSDPANLNVKNTYNIRLDGNKLILTLKDSTDELYKEDIGNVLTYKKK
jgi:lipopolysaccharide export LptBFGC system permease protein LptF